ncbi:MAG: imidazole glycerol phosphate synthase subunit HisH [Fimbriimonadaceae bacterium]
MKITLVDYGTGNLFSVRRAFETAGADVKVVTHPGEIQGSDRLVVPGVGAFGNCITELNRLNFSEAVHEFIATERPFLGICVGMQMLMERSLEFGEHAGLKIIPGTVEEIPNRTADSKVRKRPHIGWAPLTAPNGWQDSILKNTDPSTRFYFVHSFSVVPTDPAHILAACDYDGYPVVAAVRKDNVTGTQFHPEKSGLAGLEVIKTFLSM